MLTLERLPLTGEVGEDGRRRIGARRPAGGGEGMERRRRMRPPSTDSLAGDEENGEAHLVVASAGHGEAGGESKLDGDLDGGGGSTATKRS